MAFTLQDAITRARYITNDVDPARYRATDAELTLYASDGLAEIARLAPAFFQIYGELECVPGRCAQELTFDDATLLVNVTGVQGGAVVPEADIATLDRFRPAWRTDAAGPARNWMRNPFDGMKFWVYPQAPNGQVLDVLYVVAPRARAATDTISLPLTVLPAITDYIVARAESKDDEFVNSQRAAQFLQTFVARFAPAAPTGGANANPGQ